MTSSIQNDLRSSGALLRLRGIIASLSAPCLQAEDVESLKSVTNDSVMVAGRTVGQFAKAALHILGIQKADLSDDIVNELINELPNIVV